LTLSASRRFGPLFATQFLSAFNDNALMLMIAYRADAATTLSAQMLIPLMPGSSSCRFSCARRRPASSPTIGQRLADSSDQAARDPDEGAGHCRPAPFRGLSGRCKR
jgi:hypothetical protein